MRTTVWVFGDQLNRAIGALRDAHPDTHQILLVESTGKIASRPWHVQRAHFMVASMRRFAAELAREGFEVDLRRTDTMRDGFLAHMAEHPDMNVIATEPNSRIARRMLDSLGIPTVVSNQFLCHPGDFDSFARGRRSFKMEDFYRWQRMRLGILMDADQPVGGRWNYDDENRLPPPKSGHDRWPAPLVHEPDEIDRAVLADLPDSVWGEPPSGLWATDRIGALARLQHFVERVLPMFGEHEDAMLESNWHLAHSLLSPYLNNGLLLPGEVVDAAVARYESGHVPVNSIEGFVRQIIGWREFVWNIHWREDADYAERNALGAVRPLAPLFTDPSATRMACMSSVLRGIGARAYSHHIERLMVLGNFALISGTEPQAFMRWMWNSYVDAAEWVMVPNVIGMSLYADGGVMATKPYASGGAYIDRMSNHCKGCAYDRKKRTGDDACPFTVLYWDFMLRHQETLVRNPRVARQVRAAQKLSDVDEVRRTADRILSQLDSGDL